MFGQPLIAMKAWGRTKLVPGSLTHTSLGSLADTSTSGIGYTRMGGTAGGAVDNYIRWGRQSIHGYLDPSGPQLGQALVATDLVYTDPAAGTSAFYFGWWDFNTAYNTGSLVGVCWVSESGTDQWVATVKEGTGTPSTAVWSSNSGQSSLVLCRLGIVLDGNTHSAYFYINGSLKATYTPSSVPAQFGASGVWFGHCIQFGAGATAYMHILGGGNPRLLSIVEV